MTARYEVKLFDQAGTQVALVTDESPEFVSLYFTKIRNAPGQIRFEVTGANTSQDTAALFEIDGQIEVWRRAPEFGITSFYKEWEGFHTAEEKLTLDNGDRRYVSHGSTYLDLVRREELGYYSGTSFAAKEGPGETVIKAYVNENIGPGANSIQRIDNGTMPGLIIETDYARGLNWKGSRSWRPLLDIVQEIAENTGLVFDIVNFGPAQFVFNVYETYRGSDRTPGNPGHFPPVVFSIENNNMLRPHLTRNRADEINVVYVLGPGEGTDRDVTVRRNSPSIALSPWNRRVLSRNAVQEDTDNGDMEGLEFTGDGVLSSRQVVPELSFEPQQVNNFAYGHDYFFGDLVHATYEDFEEDLEIIQVEITVNDEGEDIRFEFR